MTCCLMTKASVNYAILLECYNDKPGRVEAILENITIHLHFYNF